MKTSWQFFLLTVILVMLVGCGEEENWYTVEDEMKKMEVLTFMEEYRVSWEQSLRKQNYSTMEQFFVPNSQVFHMQRRQHQSLSGERKVEVLTGYENPILEVSDHGQYRWMWKELISIEQMGKVTQEQEEYRVYYIGWNRNKDLKITAISRVLD
ncbi:MAG: hypothetical protein LRY73_13015 [Bacillus sp. (in: Bacteria)]|nr:hypothetical protein [Bacillus sp. (in: firmicutes)]